MGAAERKGIESVSVSADGDPPPTEHDGTWRQTYPGGSGIGNPGGGNGMPAGGGAIPGGGMNPGGGGGIPFMPPIGKADGTGAAAAGGGGGGGAMLVT